MSSRVRDSFPRVIGEEKGSMAIEAAILWPVFFLIVAGIIDFSHAWYMKQVMVNASREGARYGAKFQTDGFGNRILPKDLTPSISNYIKNTSGENSGSGGYGLKALLPADANLDVSPGGLAYAETNISMLAGEELTVTITAQKRWIILNSLMPGLGTQLALSVTSEMKCE
jgi:hypothetical protein